MLPSQEPAFCLYFVYPDAIFLSLPAFYVSLQENLIQHLNFHFDASPPLTFIPHPHLHPPFTNIYRMSYLDILYYLIQMRTP